MLSPAIVTTLKAPHTVLESIFRLLRHPVLWAALLLTAVLLLWATAGAAGQPVPLMHTTEAAWPRHEAAGLAFAHPPDWSVTPLPDAAGLRLAPADAPAGTHVALTFVDDAPADLAAVERLGVVRLERDAGFDRHYVRILPRTRVDGQPAVQLRYTAYLTDGTHIEGLWIATPMPDGRLLSTSLVVHPGSYFKSVRSLYRKVLGTLQTTG